MAMFSEAARLDSIDVVMCTWKSNSAYFKRCLESINRVVRVNNFIVLDRFSTDGTIESILEVFPKADIIQTEANLACARAMGIKKVETEYFAFVDDDILVLDDWFENLFSLIKSSNKVGAVQGAVNYSIDFLEKEQSFMQRRKKHGILEITGRGYTHNTILATELVRDFNPPQTLHSWEDYLLTQHIIKKGYKWLQTSQTQAIHFRDFGDSFTFELKKYFLRAQWDAAGNRLVHPEPSLIYQLKDVSLNSAKILFLSILTSIAILDPRLIMYRLIGQIGYLKGYLLASENAVPYELRS
jgi:glycosyltransferase involved in cell wall biosynthesis